LIPSASGAGGIDGTLFLKDASMLSISSKLNRLRPIAILVAGLFCASLITQGTFAQDSGGYPALSGAYTSSAQHPRVFITPSDMNALVTRINSSGSFSAQSFARLSTKVKADLAANVDWDAVYSGCDLDIYLHAFSYEPTTGYADEIRTTT
jgi:hypothetical protein